MKAIRGVNLADWISPLVLGAAVGAVAVALYGLALLGWALMRTVMGSVRTTSFSIALLAMIISSIPIRLFLRRRPRDSFDEFLEHYHTSPEGMKLKDSLVYGLSAFASFGLGLPVGPEGGAGTIGAGIANWLNRRLKSNIPPNTIMLTGLAAGFTAIFKAPLSGFLLALELPYKGDLEKEPFISSALASATAYLVALAFRVPSIFSFTAPPQPLGIGVVLMSMGVGLLVGAFGISFIYLYRALNAAGGFFMRRASFPFVMLVGGLLIGALGYLQPASMGPGISLLNYSLLVQASTLVLLLLLVFRTVSVSATLAFGSTGGFFLPSLELGAVLGLVLGRAIYPQNPVLISLIAMAAAAAAVNKLVLVPVTFILEEVGSQYAIPILLASVISYFISYGFSIYEYQPLNKLDQGAFALEKFYRRALQEAPQALSYVKVSDVMNKNPIFARADMSVREAYAILRSKTLKAIPVVNQEGVYEGYVTLEYLAGLPSRLLDMPLSGLELRHGLVVRGDERLEEVIRAIIDTGNDHVFVVDEAGRLIGVLTETDAIRYLLGQIER